MKKNKKILIFLLILIGIIYRVIFANFLPITFDEAVTYYLSKSFNVKQIIELSRFEVIPPLLNIIYKILIFCKTELCVRWIFVVLNLITFFYLVKLTNNFIFTLLFFIFNTYLTYHGSIARMHSLNIFLSSALFYHFIKFFERDKIKDVVLFFLYSVALSLNFYPAIVLILTFFIIWFIFRNRAAADNKAILIFFLIFSFIVFVLFIYFVLPSKLYDKVSKLRFPTGIISLYIPFSFCFSETIKYSELKSYKFILFLLLISPVFYLVVNAIKRNMSDFKFKVILLVVFVSYFVIFVLSFKIPKLLFSPKYVIWLYPGFLYVLIKGIEEVKKGFRIFFSLLFIFVNIFGAYHILYNNPEDWKKIYNIVRSNFQEYDLVFFDIGALYYPFNFYNTHIPTDKLIKLNGDITVFNKESIKSCKRIWLISGHNWSREWKYKELIAKIAKVLMDFKIGEIEIILFEK